MPITTKEISKNKKCLCGNPAILCWENPISKKKYNVCPDCLDKKQQFELMINFDESNIFDINSEEYDSENN